MNEIGLVGATVAVFLIMGTIVMRIWASEASDPTPADTGVEIGFLNGYNFLHRTGDTRFPVLLNGDLVKIVEIDLGELVQGGIIHQNVDGCPGISYKPRDSEDWKVFTFRELPNWCVAGVEFKTRKVNVTLVDDRQTRMRA